uniref:Plasma membrane-associated cation-binding protein 1 n=1 Tax=Zea mays TaxID=4577 RepID=A0A804R2N2_MAIZE
PTPRTQLSWWCYGGDCGGDCGWWLLSSSTISATSYSSEISLQSLEICRTNMLQEEIDKEIEDKKTELEPKVVEAYEASPPEVKALFKDKKPVKVIKKNSAAVTKFLDELAKIGRT